MSKYDRHVADHFRLALFGMGMSMAIPVLLFPAVIPDYSLLGLGLSLSWFLWLIAMVPLMSRAARSLTRKYGAAGEAASFDWRMDAAVVVLIFLVYLANIIVGAAIYYAIGGTADSFPALLPVFFSWMAVVTLFAIGLRWIKPHIYKYLLWVRFGAKGLAATNLPHGKSPLLTNNMFLMKGSRKQLNTLSFMAFAGMLLGSSFAFFFALMAAKGFDFHMLYVDGFNIYDYLRSEFVECMSVFLFFYLLIYLYTIAKNAWHAKFGDEETGEMRLHWKKDFMVFISAFLFFLTHIFLFSVILVPVAILIPFPLGMMLGIFLLSSYLILLHLLSDRKWVGLALSRYFSTALRKIGVA